MPVLPHAQPYEAVGGPTGVLLLHGFTGSPSSMRPWAEHLHEAGYTVSVPRLPGHGTTWQELNATPWRNWYDEADRVFADLRSRCDTVFVAGLSMGGCLALRLAEEHGDQVAGLVLVNPAVASADRRLVATPVLKRLVASAKGITSDIKKPGVARGRLRPRPVARARLDARDVEADRRGPADGHVARCCSSGRPSTTSSTRCPRS